MRRHALAIAALVLFGPAAAAQDWKGMGRMEGKVTDESGKPIVNAKVKLDNKARGGGTTITTDSKGRWALLGIVAGNWDIDIVADGYAPKAIRVNLPGEMARIPPVVVALQKSGPPAELVAAAAKADAAYKEGRYAEARAEYESLLKVRPDLANTIHQQIGFSYIREKEYAKGVAELKKLLELEPNNVQARAIAAQAALEGGMLDEGKELLAGLDEATIKDPDVFFNMGVNFLNAGRTEEAVGYFTKAIDRDPKYVDGYYRRALCYLQLGKTGECRADMQKVVELDPGSAQGINAKKLIDQLAGR